MQMIDMQCRDMSRSYWTHHSQRLGRDGAPKAQRFQLLQGLRVDGLAADGRAAERLHFCRVCVGFSACVSISCC